MQSHFGTTGFIGLGLGYTDAYLSQNLIKAITTTASFGVGVGAGRLAVKTDALEEEFEIAKQVIDLRLKKGLTQKELAEKVNTSQSCIARLESGTYRNLSLSFLRRVGEALGYQPHVKFEKLKSAH